MNFDRDPTITDEYYVTAVQIFECCGVDSFGALRVDALMDKFAPDIKTNNAEFTYLKRLLDPDQSNPEINVTKLAATLHKYSESQKNKIDLDESFNLRSGQAPQDSDSGISSDGLQLLEELQCELKEKEHLAHQLRNQLDFTDRQHEETIGSLISERDTLQRHVNLLRDENLSLSQLRGDYEEAIERVAAADAALQSTNKELDLLKKRNKAHVEQISVLENDKLNLQDLLSKSKDECHRINEMYATRQSVLLEQNERLKTEHADLTSKVQDLEEFLQQILNEKLLLEMELKDSVNKYNQSHLRLDKSIDVSYTDDQMLTALDSLNADSRFSTDNRILDEESFLNVLREDPGRSTNMSLFDEIRFSICNMSRLNLTDNTCDKCWLNHSITTACTQTDQNLNDIKMCNGNNVEIGLATIETQAEVAKDQKDEFGYKTANSLIDVETQTDKEVRDVDPYSSAYKGVTNNTIATQTDYPKIELKPKITKDEVCLKTTETQTEIKTNSTITQTIGSLLKPRIIRVVNRNRIKQKNKITVETQTENELYCNNNNNIYYGPCFNCEKLKKQNALLDKKNANYQLTINKMERNLNCLDNVNNQGTDNDTSLERLIQDLEEKLTDLELACNTQSDVINKMLQDVCCATCQTDIDCASVAIQAEIPCIQCEERNAVSSHCKLRKLFWEPLKCLFQLFLVVCFLCTITVLYGASQRETCARPMPWKWFNAQDIMDLLLRIEYTADVPM